MLQVVVVAGPPNFIYVLGLLMFCQMRGWVFPRTVCLTSAVSPDGDVHVHMFGG